MGQQFGGFIVDKSVDTVNQLGWSPTGRGTDIVYDKATSHFLDRSFERGSSGSGRALRCIPFEDPKAGQSRAHPQQGMGIDLGAVLPVRVRDSLGLRCPPSAAATAVSLAGERHLMDGGFIA